MIWGPPGIGKSALLAQSFKEIRSGLDLDGHTLEGTFKHVVPYFIRRGHSTVFPEEFLRHLCREMDRHYKLKGFSFGTTTLELRDALSARITTISDKKESNDKHLVLFVDGLDEALRDGNTILQYIPDSTDTS